MKKLVLVFLCVLLVSLSSQAASVLEQKQANLVKIQKYIQLLDKKITTARKQAKVSKIIQLKGIKRDEIGRAKKLKAEIAKLKAGKSVPEVKEVKKEVAQPAVPVATQTTEQGRSASLLATGGFGGGAGILEIGYLWPLQKQMDIGVEAGLGVGSGYTILLAGLTGIMPLGNNFIGLNAGLANYSDTIADIPGVSGNVAKGSNFGVGIFGGTTFRQIKLRVGYNTSLGLMLGALYKF